MRSNTLSFLFVTSAVIFLIYLSSIRKKLNALSEVYESASYWIVRIFERFISRFTARSEALLAQARCRIGKTNFYRWLPCATKAIELQTNFPFLKISYLHHFVDYRRFLGIHSDTQKSRVFLKRDQFFLVTL